MINQPHSVNDKADEIVAQLIGNELFDPRNETDKDACFAFIALGLEAARRDALRPLKDIAHGRTDCGRPFAAEKSRQMAREALIKNGETWGDGKR